MGSPSFASGIALLGALAVASPAAAQAPPAPPPPPPVYQQPGYYPPPQAYPPPPAYAPGYPPPGYAPAYGYPPLGYAAPRPMPMDPDNPPDGYHTESRMRTGLVVGGGVLFGVPYLLSAATAAGGLSDHNDELVPLFIPVVGPFVTLSTAHVFVGTDNDLEQVGRIFGAMGLIIDGIMQVAGFSLVVVGLSVQKRVVVRDRGVPEVALGPRGATARWRF